MSRTYSTYLYKPYQILHCKHKPFLFYVASTMLLFFFVAAANAHEVTRYDKELISENSGRQILLYIWLGAKHMVTGYDHLLFLAGVIFYLKHFRDIAVFVSLFAIGHTITLTGGVLLGISVNAYIIDAIIGLSVAYKGFDNLGGFHKIAGEAPNERLAVFIFGLFHGLGLGSKLQDLGLQTEGLISNLISFNVGVELGQIAALIGMIILLRLIYLKHEKVLPTNTISIVINSGLVIAGFALMAYQITLLLTS